MHDDIPRRAVLPLPWTTPTSATAQSSYFSPHNTILIMTKGERKIVIELYLERSILYDVTFEHSILRTSLVVSSSM